MGDDRELIEGNILLLNESIQPWEWCRYRLLANFLSSEILRGSNDAGSGTVTGLLESGKRKA